VSGALGNQPGRRACTAILLAALAACAAPPAAAHEEDEVRRRPGREHLSLADHRWQWPARDHVLRVVTLRDYNTRVVLLGTTILGVCSGVVGVFALLRKRALVGDVVGHASLPGVAVAFLVMESLAPGGGKSLPGLLAGAALAGTAGMLCMTAILRLTRVKEDAALAIVLAVFFGLGMVLFTVVQQIPAGSAAGLNKFIFGTAASMVAGDVLLIAQASVVVLAVCGLLFKELALVCFDEGYASAQGWPTTALDLVLLSLVVAVAEIGAQSVGLILVVALLIIPAAGARFWSEKLVRMTLVSAAAGGLCACAGVLFSALFPRIAAGAVIVLAGGVFFIVSLCFGARRGVAWRLLEMHRLRRRVGRHDLMRAVFELLEPSAAGPERPGPRPGEEEGPPAAFPPAASPPPSRVTFPQLLAKRSWSKTRLASLLRAAVREGLMAEDAPESFRLTAEGAAQARRAARNHRLWELYLIRYADVAPSHVDRDADQIEHVLEPELVQELDDLLAQRYPELAVPPSPHRLD
jgi:manganese/zinc/iron transport system permease protein